MGTKGSGKRDHQKLKSYIVLDYLMKQSDEEHTVSAKDIIDYLQEECVIEAERRSIYRDIREINRVPYAGKRPLLPGGGSAFPRRSGPGP